MHKSWWLTSKAMPYFARDMRELGNAIPKPQGDPPYDEDSTLRAVNSINPTGKTVEFEWKQQQGAKYGEVGWIRPVEAQSADQQIESTQPVELQQQDDDDIPF